MVCDEVVEYLQHASPEVTDVFLQSQQQNWELSRMSGVWSGNSLQQCSVDARVLVEFSPAGFPTGSEVIDSAALTAALSTLHWPAPLH